MFAYLRAFAATNRLLLDALGLIAAMALALLLVMGSCHAPAPADAAARAWVKERAVVLHNTDSLQQVARSAALQADRATRTADSLRRSSQTLEQTIRTTTQTIGVLRRRSDSLRTQTDGTFVATAGFVAVQDSIIHEQDSVITTQTKVIVLAHAESDTLRSALRFRTNQAVQEASINQALREALVSAPIAKPERFLGFIPLPSRKSVALITAGATAMTIFTVQHR
jgi:hypothetical protein